MKKSQLFRKLGERYPKRLAESYDHVGLMCGALKEDIKTILLCLDYDDEVYPTALKLHPDLILSHHPFLFGTKAAVLSRDPIKKDLYERTAAAGLAVYSMHTNFDTGTPGMNDALAEALDLEGVKPLDSDPTARGGSLPEPMEVHAFAEYAKKRFNMPYGLLVANGKKEISRVAIIGGGGSRSFYNAMKEGYDIFISGDAPHHVRRDVVLNHFNYLDFPHEVEKIFLTQMKKTLLEIDPTLHIETIDHEAMPEVI